MTETTTPTKRDRKGLILGTTIAMVALLIVGGGFAFAVANQAEPEAPPVASTEQPAVPEKPAPVTTPTVEPVALPTDCRKIYTQEFLDTYGTLDLNHESVVDSGVSAYEPIESIREALPGIKCQWGGPTEGGIHTAVNSSTPEVEIELIAAAKGSGFTCEGIGDDTTLCRFTESFPEDESDPSNPTVWTHSEDVYLRDGLAITTWWAGTRGSIDSVTQPIYETLWP